MGRGRRIRELGFQDLVLWVVGGLIARRSPGAKSKEVSAESTANALPAKKGAGKTRQSQAPIDEEMAEIEALLKSRGIE